MRRALAILALATLLLPGCGRSDRSPSPAERARAARDAAARKRAEAARKNLDRARALARRGDTEKAWAAWRAAREITGETPELARTADAIRKVEREARRKDEYRRLLDLLNRDTKAATPKERLEILARAAEAAREYLENHPEDTEHREEIEAGRRYAERELSLHRAYVEALAEARAHLAAGRYRKCIEACNRALGKLDDRGVREIKERALRALTPEGMVFIPEGFFLAGRDRVRTWLPAFYIDRTEVTNARYAAFCRATGHPVPRHWIQGRIPRGRENHPVVHVTLEDALAFAAWAKRRLPTELQWERAARGTDGRAYPWGDRWDPAKGNFGPRGTQPVGSRPLDRSPDGVLDMGGNVMEMTLPPDDPGGKHSGPVMRGGHWSDDFHPSYALTYARYPVDRAHQDSGSGFRCVLPAESGP